MVAFAEIPANIRSPLAYIEVDSSQNSLNTVEQKRILVLGQMLAGGTATAEVPVLVSSAEQAKEYFGEGSILAEMFYYLFLNNSFTEKWCVPSADVSGGTAATGSIVVTGPATANGTLSLYIGGSLISVPVVADDTATEIGEAIEAAINAVGDLLVTANNSSGTVTITYKHKGTIGNYYNMQLNYGGVTSGEITPAGVTVTITQLSSGATDPDLTDAIAALPDQIFDYWLVPYQASGTLDDLDDAMDDRWSGLKMLEGHVFGAVGGSASAVAAIGAARNGKHMSLLDAGLDSPTPAYIWASAAVGQIATSASADPSLPFTTLKLRGVKPSAFLNQRSLSQKNTLLYSGIASHLVTRGGDVQLERVITNYQVNSFGTGDPVWLDAQTPLTIAFLRQSLRGRINSKFARKKLADDGNNFGAGLNIITPSTVKAEIVAWASEMKQGRGLIENLEDFKALLIVERDVDDRTRVNVQLSPNLVNQLYIFAAKISFIL